MTSVPTPSDAGTIPPEALRAARRLHTAFEAAGFVVERDLAFCRPGVTSSGQAFVELGRLPLTAADRLAALIEQLGSSCDDEEQDEHVARNAGSDRHRPAGHISAEQEA